MMKYEILKYIFFYLFRTQKVIPKMGDICVYLCISERLVSDALVQQLLEFFESLKNPMNSFLFIFWNP